MNFQKATIFDLMRYIEDLETRAFIANLDALDVLDKDLVSKKIPKDIYYVVSNTMKSAQNGDLSVDGKNICTSKNRPVDCLVVPESAGLVMYHPKSAKDLGSWLMDRQEWDIKRVNIENGARFASDKSPEWFDYKVSDGTIIFGGVDDIERKYMFGQDFHYVAFGQDGEIYLLDEWEGDSIYKVIDKVHYIIDGDSV